MATKVKGNDIIISIRDGDTYKPVACAVSGEITSSADILEKTTTGSGYWKTYAYQRLSWQVTCDGVIILDDESTKASLFYLLDAQHSFLELLLQCTIQDDEGNAKTVSGNVLIPSIVFSGAVDDFGRHQETFQGSGGLLVTDGLVTNITVTISLTELSGSTGSVDSVTLVDEVGSEYDLLVSPLMSGSTTADVPSGTYKLRVTITSNHATNTWSHDASPGDTQFFGAGTSVFYNLPEPVWDFTEDRTISVTTGGA